MKKFVFGILGIALLASCDKVDRRFGCTSEVAVNYDENALYDDGSCKGNSGCKKEGALNYDPDPAVIEHDGSCKWENKKRVMIEEFTAYNCINCPLTAEEVNKLKKEWGDAIVVVGVHGTGLANPVSGLPDYRTEWGTKLIDGFGVQGIPALLVNRTEHNGKVLLNSGGMEAAFRDLFDGENEANLSFHHEVNGSTIKIDYDVDFQKSFSGEVGIMAYITESNLISPQKHATQGNLFEYNHKHVFRQEYSGGALSANSGSVSGSFDVTLDDAWVPENCELIVFIYEQDSDIKERRIIQVGEAHVIHE